MNKTAFYWFFAASFILLISCGGGSGGVSDDADDDSGATITSLSDIPDDVLNPRAYDLTTQEASLSAEREGQVGEFSRAGCETDSLKKNIIRNAILPRMILCKIQSFEAAAGGTAAGDGVFSYWNMGAAEGREGPPGVEDFDPRVAIKLDGSTFTFVMCDGTDKSMELVISTSNNIYSGHVTDKWGEEMQGILEFSADGLPSSASLSRDFTLASFTQSFIEDGDYFSGYGSATLEATPTYNIVSGFNSGTMADGGTFAGSTQAKFDASEGTAEYQMDAGSFPGQTVEEAFAHCTECQGSAEDWIDPHTGWLVSGDPCSLTDLTVNSVLCFGGGVCPTEADDNGQCNVETGQTHTESFGIDATDPFNLVFTVAETSIYAADVAATEMPDSSTEPTIEFTSASADVDCSTSDTWTIPTLTGEPDMTDCLALEEEMNDWQFEKMCATEEAEQHAGEGEEGVE